MEHAPNALLNLERRHWLATAAASFALVAPGAADEVRSGPSTNPFERKSRSKKGLQVQMPDDAVALGVQHAAINVDLSRLIIPQDRSPDSIEYLNEDQTFRFHRATIENLDRQIAPLSQAGMLVYLILLAYESKDPSVNQITLHPKYDPRAPNHVSAFNTETDEGRRWLAACATFLAQRYSSGDRLQGVVAGFIIGNEVNSHWFWYNRGHSRPDDIINDYVRAVRIVHTCVRLVASWPRIYISLDHHWNIAAAFGATAEQAIPGKQLLDRFAAQIRAGGDFDWHVAYHPYPENLGDPRFWNDRTALDHLDSPRITFKNLPVLVRYLQQDQLRCAGGVRRIILSEQGFHTPNEPTGQLLQAAAFCYAYRLVERLEAIDAFILHRHVDHAQEGGLALGLWTRREDSICTPFEKKRIYEPFRLADTESWQAAFEFALPIVGINAWPEAL